MNIKNAAFLLLIASYNTVIISSATFHAQDGSYVHDRNRNWARIVDPKNNAYIVVFNVNNKPAELYAPYFQRASWTNTMEGWIHNPAAQLKISGYLTPGHKNYKPTEAQRSYWTKVHNFAVIADTFVPEFADFGTPYLGVNGETRMNIRLPGTYSIDGLCYIGMFTYMLDLTTGTLFHRMFQPEGAQQTIDTNFRAGRWKVPLDAFKAACGKK